MYPSLVSCPFYAIPIYPFKFMTFFLLVSCHFFYCHLRGMANTVIISDQEELDAEQKVLYFVVTFSMFIM